MSAYDDGCTFWFDGDWRQCCEAHDQAYLDGTVTIATHFELGACVAQTSGGLTMGLAMCAATALWWILRGRRRGR